MQKKWIGLLVLGLLVAGKVRAADTDTPLTVSDFPAPAVVVSDPLIHEREKQIDEGLAARLEILHKAFEKQAAVRNKAYEDRVNLERRLADDRKAFLNSQRGKPVQEVRKALRVFDGQEKDKRRAFGKNQPR